MFFNGNQFCFSGGKLLVYIYNLTGFMDIPNTVNQNKHEWQYYPVAPFQLVICETYR